MSDRLEPRPILPDRKITAFFAKSKIKSEGEATSDPQKRSLEGGSEAEVTPAKRGRRDTNITPSKVPPKQGAKQKRKEGTDEPSAQAKPRAKPKAKTAPAKARVDTHAAPAEDASKDTPDEKQSVDAPGKPKAACGLAGDISNRQLKLMRRKFDRQTGKEADSRAREPGTRDAGKKCPESLVLVMLNNKAEQAKWFKIWLGENGDWMKVKMREEYEEIEARETNKTVSWLTLGMLEKMYNDKSVAAEIAKSKTESGDWKPHPEIPHCKAAILFKCWLSEQEVHRMAKMHKKQLVAEGEIDGDAAEKLMAHMSRWLSKAGVEHQGAKEDPAQSSEEKAKAEEEAAAKKAEEEAKKEDQRLQKIEEAKHRREAAKQEPEYKARAWLSGMANFLGTLLQLQAQANSATLVPETIRSFYSKKFKEQEKQLTKMRSDIEAALSDKEALVGVLKRAEQFSKDIKSDQTGWNSVHKAHYPIPKAVK